MNINKALFDERACSHTLGCLLLDTSLVDDINKPLDRNDFNGERFYEIIFIAIYNLVMQGIEVIDEFAIDSYLNSFKEQYEVFQKNDGLKFISEIREMSNLQNYDWYYHKMRKLSLLRYYESQNLDVKFIYDWSKDDIDGQEQNKFDEYSENQIVDMVENIYTITPRMKYCTNVLSKGIQAGMGMIDLIHSYMETPDFGYPLSSQGLNTIARGARKGKFLFRSAKSGAGKTRSFIMDAANFAVPWKWNKKKQEFEYTGHCVPTLYIGTEGSLEEFQTIFNAAVSGVDEEHILFGEYEEGELERVEQAAKYIAESPLHLEYMDDFSISDIENLTKKYVYSYGIEVMILDYLQTTLRLMSEVSKKSSGLKEYQLLIIFSTRMKAMAERLDIFVESGSQVNIEKDEPRYYDQRVLQGSKAVANKIDVGIIQTDISPRHREKIIAIMRNMVGKKEPNILQWCYKCRSGRLSRIIICSYFDMATMTIEDQFVVDFDFNLIDIDFTKIEMVNKAVKDNSKKISDNDFEETDKAEVQADNDNKWNISF